MSTYSTKIFKLENDIEQLDVLLETESIDQNEYNRRLRKLDSEHPNLGTSLEDFLKEDGNLEGATAVAVKRVLAWQQEMEKRSLTKTAMAKMMHTSRNQLDRVLSPDDGNVTIETLHLKNRS